MSTTLYKLPTIVVANGTGVNAWQNSSNILLVDNEFASTSDTTAELTVGTFNLAIPDDSTITNFTVKVKGYRGSFNTTLSIYAIDSSSGVSYSYPMATFQGFSGTNTEYTLPSTLFGTTWDSTQANNIQLKLMVDPFSVGLLAEIFGELGAAVSMIRVEDVPAFDELLAASTA